MSSLPSGTVTFLFTDVEGSTRLLQELGDDWAGALADERRLLRGAVAEASGREVDTQGDAFFFVFARARDAVEAAAGGQRALAAHAWPQGRDLRVRMGLHTGEPAVGDEGYLGLDVVRAARICSLARGGQVLVSATTRALVGGDDFVDLGRHRLKDIDADEHLFQLTGPGLEREFEPLGAPEAAPAELPLELAGRETEYARRAEAMAARIQAGVREEVERSLQGLPDMSELLGDALPQPPAERPSRLRRLLGRRRT